MMMSTASSPVGEPEVTVIMPVHNGAAFIEEAIRSIQSQTLKAWELIVLDDGSTDNSPLLADRLAAVDNRIRVVRLPRVGLAAALNRGIDEARAPWVARMDADDVSLPERLERQLAFLQVHPDVAAVGAFGWMIGETGKVVGISRVGPTSYEQFRVLRERSLVYLLTPSVVFSREVALKLGKFQDTYSPGEDVEFWTRIADDHTVLVVPDVLLRYRIHARSQSTEHIMAINQNLKRAWANTQRRRAGEPDCSEDEWFVTERIRPLYRRARERSQWRGQAWYRRGASQLAAGQVKGFVLLAAASVLAPKLVLKRLSKQEVVPVLHRKFREHLRTWQGGW